MTLRLPELDRLTRERMVRAFDEEERAVPYRSQLLTLRGRHEFPTMMRAALVDGDDESLGEALAVPEFWLPSEQLRDQRTARRVNVRQAASRLAMVEFNTWYVRGFAARLLDEGEPRCVVRAARDRSWDPECPQHDGLIVGTRLVYNGHRARYWPTPSPAAFSIPTGPGCSHTIHRI